MFNNYFVRNNEPLSQKLINDLNESEGLLSFVLKNSTPLNIKLIKKIFRSLKKNDIYLRTDICKKKEDNMLFEEYLEHFEEIK